MTTYLFVTKPEYEPEHVETGETTWWSCGSKMKSGDRALVYVTGAGITYEWQATADAEPDPEWKNKCSVSHESAFEPPITIREIRVAIPKEEWSPPHLNFRGYRSIEIPDDIATKLRDLRFQREN